MAIESFHQEIQLKIYTLSPKEAVDIIGLLAAQLASVPLQGNASGATPTINIVDHGVVKHRVVFCVDNKDNHE